MQASDESNATTGKRLATVNVDNTEENRQEWRELLYTAPGEGGGMHWVLCQPQSLPVHSQCAVFA